MSDLATLGHRIRHFRNRAGFTLEQLGDRVGVAASYLSLIENGKREPRLALLSDLAHALSVSVPDLLETAPPNERAALEIELERMQSAPAYQELGLPAIRPGKGTTDDVLRSLVGLHRELDRRAKRAIATPEEARRAITRQRLALRDASNYLPDIEELALRSLPDEGRTGGALTHRAVGVMAERLGLEIVHVDDLPHQARVVLDRRNGRIYLPPASIPGGHGLRSLALQAMGHILLEHGDPANYEDFLDQRFEAAYFSAACLMPRDRALDFLGEAKAARNIAIEDFRDAFGVTHEAAALRFSNLATEHLGISLHFLRVGSDGSITRVYENDGLPLPVDVSGTAEGQVVCREWSARRAFARTTRTTEYYQYTDTPEGTFFEATQTGIGDTDEFSITVGVPYSESKWFRGRDTHERARSTCPDLSCCRAPAAELHERWHGHAWSSARVHSQVFKPLPQGTYPGIDDRELFEFLESHSRA